MENVCSNKIKRNDWISEFCGSRIKIGGTTWKTDNTSTAFQHDDDASKYRRDKWCYFDASQLIEHHFLHRRNCVGNRQMKYSISGSVKQCKHLFLNTFLMEYFQLITNLNARMARWVTRTFCKLYKSDVGAIFRNIDAKNIKMCFIQQEKKQNLDT